MLNADDNILSLKVIEVFVDLGASVVMEDFHVFGPANANKLIIRFALKPNKKK